MTEEGGGGMTTLLTSKDVAVLLSVSPKTIARWAKRGLIPVAMTTVGGHRRFEPAEIDQLLATLTTVRNEVPS